MFVARRIERQLGLLPTIPTVESVSSTEAQEVGGETNAAAELFGRERLQIG